MLRPGTVLRNGGAQQNQGLRPRHLFTTPLHDTPSTMTTPLHRTVCCELIRLTRRGAAGCGRYRAATSLADTPSRHPFDDDDTPSRQQCEAVIATHPVTPAFQSSAHENTYGATSSLCEVNPQTPISKRGGVRAVFLNLFREAGECGASTERRLRCQPLGAERAKSLGLDETVGGLAQRKFAGLGEQPGFRWIKSDARKRIARASIWVDRRIECRVRNTLDDSLRIDVCAQRLENRLRATAGDDQAPWGVTR